MFFSLALFSSLLLLSLVLASPSRHHGRMARRHDSSDAETYSVNWGGAVLSKSNGTFNSVTGTITVPWPTGQNGSAASVWVGLDGDNCSDVILQTGINFILSDGNVTYDAWYEWYPAPVERFTGINIAAGNVVRLTVSASSTTSGTATVENLTNGQLVSRDINSSTPICGRDAGWIVGDFLQHGSLLPLANFSTVTFTDAEARGPDDYYSTPSEASIVNIRQNNQVLTSAWVDGSSVGVWYKG